MLSLKEIVLRGARKRCPQCGKSGLFERWNELREQCPECGCEIRAREDETWFFMYMSTAAMTGVFIIGMFLFVPGNITLAKWVVAALAVALFFGTTEMRKGIAIAIDYYVDRRSEFSKRH